MRPSLESLRERVLQTAGWTKSSTSEPKTVAVDEGENVYAETIIGHLASYNSLLFIVAFVLLDICACGYYQVAFYPKP